MDKTGIIVISLCVVLLGWWFLQQEKIAQQQARYAQTNQLAQAQIALAATNSSNAAMSAMTPAVKATATAAAFDPNAPEQLIVLTNADARYTFTSHGGGLKLVELLDYPQTISARWKTKSGAQTNGDAALNMLAEVPSLAVLGDASLVGDGIFTLTRTATGVHAEKTLASGLRLVKDFQPSSNYLVNATVRLENTTDKPLSLPEQEYVVGTATPMDADDLNFYNYGGAMWFDGANPQVCNPTYFNTNTSYFGVISRTPHSEYVAGATNVVWAAVFNQFFALAAMPKQPAEQVVAQSVTLPPFPNIEMTPGAATPIGVQTALIYPAQTLTANSSVERQIVLFAGPKEYRTLARVGAELQNRADLVMNFGTGFSSFWGIGTFFAKLLLSAMNALHDLTKLGYGWTIVLITVLLRGIFWPLMAASTRSMKRMAALKPEMDALKEKYKDDQQKFAQKQMELWKTHNVSPMSGCWPMLLQMPVFMGFFTMIRSAIELRGAHFLWVTDLSKPDTLFMIPGLNFPFNLLPLMMGGAMLWQTHLTPPSPGMDASQQKLMRYMPLMFLVFLYNYSGGLAL
ncbi:MAG TPA: membrane protein insertase YidC, partial [Verrucomicrobiae bacterium]|nr:membrane protein insertase YidC [Verrucomicrobiae bacterium]